MTTRHASRDERDNSTGSSGERYRIGQQHLVEPVHPGMLVRTRVGTQLPRLFDHHLIRIRRQVLG